MWRIRSSTFASGLSISSTTASIASPSRCGGHVRRHPDRDPGRAVHEQVREAGRQHLRLPRRLVVVRLEVDRVGVDVPQHLGRDPREPALRVAHRRGGVVVEVPEVALPVDERVPQRERLGHPDERVVDRLVAVRVVGPHHVADDLGALLVRPVRLHPGLVHPVEDAPVHGLQPVAHVGQRARRRSRSSRSRGSSSASPARARASRCGPARAGLPERDQTSRNRTSWAFCSMNARRGSTWSPISIEKISSASGRVLDLDADEHPLRGIHRRLPELVGVHLAEALEAADLDALLRELERVVAERLERLRGPALLPVGERRRAARRRSRRASVRAAEARVDR